MPRGVHEKDRDLLLNLLPLNFSQLDYQRNTQKWFFALMTTIFGGVVWKKDELLELFPTDGSRWVLCAILGATAIACIAWMIVRHIRFLSIDSDIKYSIDRLAMWNKNIPTGLRKGPSRTPLVSSLVCIRSFLTGTLPYVLILGVIATIAIVSFIPPMDNESQQDQEIETENE